MKSNITPPQWSYRSDVVCPQCGSDAVEGIDQDDRLVWACIWRRCGWLWRSEDMAPEITRAVDEELWDLVADGSRGESVWPSSSRLWGER